MKVAVWRTNHEIADTVADVIYKGLRTTTVASKASTSRLEDGFDSSVDCHIGYGILRGIDQVFRACDKLGKPWIHIDKGYFKPGHYEGFYRVSLNGTQQTFGLDKLEPDYDRLAKLDIDILDPKFVQGTKSLVCPPTDHVKQFFNLSWHYHGHQLIRNKSCRRPFQQDLDNAREVCTFNSSVGWEALRQGIPVVSDPNHSIVGAYQKLMDKSINDDYNERRRLFGVMASLQLTLEEMKQGMLWPVILKLLSLSKYSSDTIAAKP